MKQMLMLSSRKLAVQLGISNHFHSLEAIRQIKSDIGRDNVMYIHVPWFLTLKLLVK